ncbi:ABC transporter permease [Brevibacillus laterosporus]|uniref:Multidrug ABC transporter substrate-binding protein n=1 Tax=Brevibacillus laterosporus TaxID=1465 RepID=A0AAP8U4H3_BRELA|nr:ABC transporter permease [Brevibacillus laterosporus]MBG9771796.1 multidrug ABC transporter substrate-binding protein [Brevibacillus laterosporus]MED1662964.1 ABC transporter permease [Brevibacillus laterosporus]MED1668978.1 ABC transporter permease [Brevibacillus laterosporus]MED1716559.1 ABC transporter permease [Brevibacillus laterosporus]PPA86397.1 multidrug ABC transporter substrate-binding protein [Brevibacillus laterosporus]
MNYWEAMRVSLRSVTANKLRSFLTMLGIMIGVSAVITMVAIGEGAKASVANRINGLGSNLLIISAGQAKQGGISLGAGSLSLRLEDAKALQQKDSIAGVTPAVSTRAQLVYQSDNYLSSLEGTTEAFPEVRNVSLQEGRFFTSFEVSEQANVVVIGSEIVTNLFASSNESPIGKTIEINRIPFTVVGILKSQGSSGMTNNDDKVIIPITTAMERLGQSSIRTIYASATSEDEMLQAQFDIQQTLRAQHKLMPSQENDFTISSQSDILETAQSVTSVMTTLLSGIAGISLVVGGIGIMNIMLVSVTERTREIGIRKAIGATKVAIMQQFLIESVTLSFLGGMIGILLGIGAAWIVNKLGGVEIAITITPMLYAFLSSLFVGVVFGVYPAKKAAEMKPIDALRYE